MSDEMDDGMDSTFLEVAASAINPNGKRARECDVTDAASSMKQKGFQSALHHKLSLIDPEKKLSVHQFLDDDEKDPVVDEYVEKLVKIGFYPNKPNQIDIGDFDKVEMKCELSDNCHAEVVETLMAFFQTRYSNKNLIDATANRCVVIPLQAKLTIPYFAKTPAKLLKDMTEFKTTVALRLQTVGVDATDFISELLYISAAYRIHEEVSKSLKDESERVQEIQTQFEIHFLKSEMEYGKVANIKNIKFEQHRSRIKHIEPKWRALGLQPPTTIFNRLASGIKARIQRNEEKFDPASIKTEFIGFMVEGERMIEKMKHKSTQNSVAARAQPSCSRGSTSSTSASLNSNLQRPTNNHEHRSFHHQRPQQNYQQARNPQQFRNANSGRGRGVRNDSNNPNWRRNPRSDSFTNPTRGRTPHHHHHHNQSRQGRRNLDSNVNNSQFPQTNASFQPPPPSSSSSSSSNFPDFTSRLNRFI